MSFLGAAGAALGASAGSTSFGSGLAELPTYKLALPIQLASPPMAPAPVPSAPSGCWQVARPQLAIVSSSAAYTAAAEQLRVHTPDGTAEGPARDGGVRQPSSSSRGAERGPRVPPLPADGQLLCGEGYAVAAASPEAGEAEPPPQLVMRRPSALKGSGSGGGLRLPRSVSWSDEVAGGSLAEVKEFQPQPQEHWWGDWQAEGEGGAPPAPRGCACCLM